MAKDNVYRFIVGMVVIKHNGCFGELFVEHKDEASTSEQGQVWMMQYPTLKC